MLQNYGGTIIDIQSTTVVYVVVYVHHTQVVKKNFILKISKKN